MFAQAAIDAKREDYHRALVQLAKAQEVLVGQDDVYDERPGASAGVRRSRAVPPTAVREPDPTYEGD